MMLAELRGTCWLPAMQARSQTCLSRSRLGPQPGSPPLVMLLPAVAQAGTHHPAASLPNPNFIQSRCGFTKGKHHVLSFSNHWPYSACFYRVLYVFFFLIKAQLALLPSLAPVQRLVWLLHPSRLPPFLGFPQKLF